MVAELAYVAGLLATDGNLGQRKPVITIVSKDTDLLETVRRLGRALPESKTTESRKIPGAAR